MSFVEIGAGVICSGVGVPTSEWWVGLEERESWVFLNTSFFAVARPSLPCREVGC